MLKDLQHFLTEPKILGKILEWGLIWGSVIGILCLLVAMFVLKERKAMIFSLLLLAASALLGGVMPHARQCASRPFTICALWR